MKGIYPNFIMHSLKHSQYSNAIGVDGYDRLSICQHHTFVNKVFFFLRQNFKNSNLRGIYFLNYNFI